jgi:hypothetical protein
MRVPYLRSATTLLPAVLIITLPAHAQFSGSWETDFSKHTVPLDEIVSGGPPKDGIPSIDDPDFVSIREAGRWLDDREPVVVVAIGGEAKAYPLQILIWHEIANDVVGGVPVSVTYCPLCNTALAFDRRFDGRVLDFGTTGRLRHSDLVMYDRQTETWWQQATGEGIVGEYAGEQLTFIAARPTGRTPISATIGRAARRGGASSARTPTSGSPPWSGSSRSAWEKRAVNDHVEGVELVVLWSPGMASSVDSREIADGRDVGASGVFSRRVASRTLTFEPVGDGLFRDRETGSTWNILGRAIRGELNGTQLEPITHGNHFWFAWAVFKPETRIVR